MKPMNLLKALAAVHILPLLLLAAGIILPPCGGGL